MPEWVVVALVGAFGGLINAVVHKDVSWPQRYRTRTGRWTNDPGTPGEMIAGAVAGGVVWVFNHAHDNFLGPAPADMLPYLASFFAGLGGGRVLRSYYDKGFQNDTIADTARTLRDVASEFIGEDEDDNRPDAPSHEDPHAVR